MKLFFILVLNVLFFNYVFSQSEIVKDENSFSLFSKKSFDCSYTKNNKRRKNVIIKEETIVRNNQELLQIVIKKLSKKNDTILVSKVGNTFVLHSTVNNSLKSRVFIDFDKELNTPIVFWSGSIFGIGSYLVKSEDIKDEQYLVSVVFEGIEIHSNIIYQIDFNKNKEIYRFYYFNGHNGLICQ